MQVVFIGGLGRSGSTLLERILSELPGVCALGEVMQVWRRVQRDDRCSCGAELSACAFWRAVGEHAFGGWHRVDCGRVLAVQQAVERLRHLPLLAASRLTRHRQALVAEYTDFYARIYRAAAAVTGSQVVVDASKRPALAFCLRWAHDVDLRVVHLVRDPRGVAYSWTKHVAQPPKDGAAMMPRYRPAASACYWTAFNAAFGVLATGRRHNGTGSRVPVHRLRYEDLLADPRRTVRQLARFAGVSPSASDLDYIDQTWASLSVCHTIAGNPIRFTSGPVELRRDDAWRTALPAAQRQLVSLICAPLLAAYGYPLTARGGR